MVNGTISSLHNKDGEVAFPITVAKAIYMDDGNTTLEAEVKRIDKQFISYVNKINITVDDFGAVGDGITDDSIALQKAFDWSKLNSKPIFLMDKKYYTSKTLNVGSSIIRSLSNVSGDCDIMFLKKKDGNYLNGVPNFSYLFNLGGSVTWRNVIDNVAYVCKFKRRGIVLCPCKL